MARCSLTGDFPAVAYSPIICRLPPTAWMSSKIAADGSSGGDAPGGSDDSYFGSVFGITAGDALGTAAEIFVPGHDLAVCTFGDTECSGADWFFAVIDVVPGGKVFSIGRKGLAGVLGAISRRGDAGTPGRVRSRPNEPLGDLTPDEIAQIQDVVDEAGRPLEVVGSAASGSRRGVGTDLPIGKGPGKRSDIDVLIPPSSRQHFDGLEGRLPSVDPATGVLTGVHNPQLGPAIRFEPGQAPTSVPGAGG